MSRIDDDDDLVVKDGERVRVPLMMRDSRSGAPVPINRLRDMDTGAVVTLDEAHVAAVRVEAARAAMPVEQYLRDRLRYSIEGNKG